MLDIHRSGRLCRKCLGLVDSTPAALLGSAFGLMSETFQHEVTNNLTLSAALLLRLEVVNLVIVVNDCRRG